MLLRQTCSCPEVMVRQSCGKDTSSGRHAHGCQAEIATTSRPVPHRQAAPGPRRYWPSSSDRKKHDFIGQIMTTDRDPSACRARPPGDRSSPESLPQSRQEVGGSGGIPHQALAKPETSSRVEDHVQSGVAQTGAQFARRGERLPRSWRSDSGTRLSIRRFRSPADVAVIAAKHFIAPGPAQQDLTPSPAAISDGMNEGMIAGSAMVRLPQIALSR